jgi:hypothetical protein
LKGERILRGKKYKAEEIIPKLPEAEVLMSQGMMQDLAAKQIGVSTETRTRWRKE